MISKNQIENFLIEEFKSNDIFLVGVNVNPGNQIKVFVDKPEDITIRECFDVSRLITGFFDRDVEDYSLDVSSPGLDLPFVVKEQYEKNIGQIISVLLLEGKEHKGVLKSHNENGIEIEEKLKVKIEGKKNKQWKTELLSFKFDDIKTVKVVISFK